MILLRKEREGPLGEIDSAQSEETCEREAKATGGNEALTPRNKVALVEFLLGGTARRRFVRRPVESSHFPICLNCVILNHRQTFFYL